MSTSQIMSLIMRLVIHKLPRTAAGDRSRLSGERLQQGGRVVAAEVDDAVDEQGRCTLHLTGGHSALDIPSNAPQDLGAGSVAVESGDIELELPRVVLQIVVLEGGLMTVEQIVHFPEPVLDGSCLGRGRCRESVGVDLCERKVPEGEADLPVRALFDAFDFSKRLPGIGAFVIAVLDNETAFWPAADVIDLLVNRFQGPRTILRHRIPLHRQLLFSPSRAFTVGSSVRPPE